MPKYLSDLVESFAQLEALDSKTLAGHVLTVARSDCDRGGLYRPQKLLNRPEKTSAGIDAFGSLYPGVSEDQVGRVVDLAIQELIRRGDAIPSYVEPGWIRLIDPHGLVGQ